VVDLKDFVRVTALKVNVVLFLDLHVVAGVERVAVEAIVIVVCQVFLLV
jgi:hypothetical protein